MYFYQKALTLIKFEQDYEKIFYCTDYLHTIGYRNGLMPG